MAVQFSRASGFTNSNSMGRWEKIQTDLNENNNISTTQPKKLRAWQTEAYNLLHDKSHGIINAPTGCGKSYAIASITSKKLISNKKMRAIIVVPQTMISSGFAKSQKLILPTGEILDGKSEQEWKPTHNLCLMDDLSASAEKSKNDSVVYSGSTDAFKCFLMEKQYTQDIDFNDRILLCCNQTFVLAIQQLKKQVKDGILSKSQYESALSNLFIVIDEAHHIQTGDINENDPVSALNESRNELGAIITELHAAEKNNVNILLVTATFYRGDQGTLLSEKILATFCRYNLPYDKWLPQMQHLRSFSYDYVFDDIVSNDYFDGVEKSINHLFDCGYTKQIIYIPTRGTTMAKMVDDKDYEVKKIISLIGKKIGADNIDLSDINSLKEPSGLIVLKRPDGSKYKILDLVTQEGREIRKEFFANANSPINKDRDSLDCIIALKMFTEGADWEHANGMIIMGDKPSLTDLIQRVGRVLRDAPGKPTAKILQILPIGSEDRPLPEDQLLENLNTKFKALALGMLMENVFNTAPKLQEKPKNKNQENNTVDRKKLEKENGEESPSVLNKISMDENEIVAASKNALKGLIADAGLAERNGLAWNEDMAIESVKKTIKPAIEEIVRQKNMQLTEEEIDTAAREFYTKIKIQAAKDNYRQKFGFDPAHITWEMIDKADVLSYVLRFVGKTIDGKTLIELRNILKRNETESNTMCKNVCEWIIKHNKEPQWRSKSADEKSMGYWLANYRQAHKGSRVFYESDQKIADSYGFSNLLLPVNPEEESNKLCKELCEFVKANNRTPNKTEKKLYSYICNRRRAKNGAKGTIWYESDQKIVESYGFDCLLKSVNPEEESNKLCKELCEFVKANNRTPNKTEKKLYSYICNRRRAKNGAKGLTWYESDQKIADSYGFSNLLMPYNPEEESNKLCKELCEFVKANNRTPNKTEKKLYTYICNRRQAKKSKKGTTWYESDQRIAESYGLPWVFQPAKVGE